MRSSIFRSLAFVAVTVLTGFAVPPAVAADAPRTLSVSGSGEAKGVPDQARLSAGVATLAATADAALRENSRTMNAVFDMLKKVGVPQKAIQTSNFSVQPQYPPYNQNGGGQQRIVGYQVSNQIDVTLDDTARLGAVLDALVVAGANQINAVSFSIRDTDALLATARNAAVSDAIKRAKIYAQAAGVSLGAVLSLQENSSDAPRPMYRAVAMASGGDAPTPTAAGEQSVTATVSMVFEIK
jgi:uncharacterized protein